MVLVAGGISVKALMENESTRHLSPKQQDSGVVNYQKGQPRCQKDQDHLTDRQTASQLLELSKQSGRHLSLGVIQLRLFSLLCYLMKLLR
jgi:hypothetical protein